jgi:hypothetical protein
MFAFPAFGPIWAAVSTPLVRYVIVALALFSAGAWSAHEIDAGIAARHLVVQYESMQAETKRVIDVGAATAKDFLQDATLAKTDAEKAKRELADFKRKGERNVAVNCPREDGKSEPVMVKQADVVFGGDVAVQWNRLLRLADKVAAVSGAGPGRADAAEEQGHFALTVSDLLDNLELNVEGWRADRDKLDGWQDYAVKRGIAKPWGGEGKR